jgi:hypothetical protein
MPLKPLRMMKRRALPIFQAGLVQSGFHVLIGFSYVVNGHSNQHRQVDWKSINNETLSCGWNVWGESVHLFLTTWPLTPPPPRASRFFKSWPTHADDWRWLNPHEASRLTLHIEQVVVTFLRILVECWWLVWMHMENQMSKRVCCEYKISSV